MVCSSCETELYLSGLTRTALFDQKCSAKNAPTGITPLKEWSFLRRYLESGPFGVADMPSPLQVLIRARSGVSVGRNRVAAKELYQLAKAKQNPATYQFLET